VAVVEEAVEDRGGDHRIGEHRAPFTAGKWASFARTTGESHDRERDRSRRLHHPELNALRERVELRMEELREQGVPAMRERFAEEAAALGVTLEEVIGPPKKNPCRPQAEAGGEQGATGYGDVTA
jgi:hypothetical protein